MKEGRGNEKRGFCLLTDEGCVLLIYCPLFCLQTGMNMGGMTDGWGSDLRPISVVSQTYLLRIFFE